jgi:hypothetical protein
MGLLDDAIREHLELKRRRGADPAEVEQQEREALGPVRGAPAAEAPPAAEPAEPAGAVAEAPREPEPPPLPADPEPAPLADPDPLPEREHHGAYRAPEPPPPAPEQVSQPTQQFSVEDLEEVRRETDREDVVAADAEPDPEAEDVLDETPDFLQEAPEHDRLWFEQRPPRDFDF